MSDGLEIKARIEALREKMTEAGADWYLMTTADPHGSEYINPYYREREFFSGFTGSNGDLLVGKKEALLWTDGRYFVQAAKELEGSGIRLMKMGQAGVPKLTEYIADKISMGECFMADGRLISADLGKRLAPLFKEKRVIFISDKNLTEEIWENRPSDSAGKIRVLPESLTGSNPSRRIGHVVVKMREHGAASHVITKLDDQMWLLNLRGEDIACNPVAYSYTIINGRDVSVYLKKASAMTSVCDSLRHSGITVKDYDDFYDDLEKMNLEAPVLLDSNNINYRAYQILWKKGRIIDKINPTEEMKAVKNATEIAHIKDVYLYDSAILTRFLFFMKKNAVRQKITEFEAAELLDGMRAQLDGFRGLSFPTISAWKGNAAMMHYEATLYDNAVIDGDGLYLVDSGGQYDGGTTDVTRTLVLGKVSDEIRLHFTRTVMAMLRLQNTIFLKGCTGLNLDIIARQPMWEMGMDYKCGTGHGIGYMLNVHEGPHNIRWAHRGERPETPIVPGMIVSDEPGVYVEGSHGIRIENIELCREITENDDGTFLGFEPLTLVPIDLDGIIPEEMQPRDNELLNNYHALVRKKLMPFMQGEDIAMLNEATKAIG